MKYHKIHTVYKRDPDNNYRTLVEGEFSKPEFEYLARNNWLWTEKVDGTNIRVLWGAISDSYLEFRGRTDKSNIPPFLLDTLEETFSRDKMEAILSAGEFILYGEGYGNKIQKAGKHYNQNEVGFILFDVFYVDHGIWLEQSDVSDIAFLLGIPAVPEVGYGPIHEAVEYVKQGFPSALEGANLQAEGLVLRPEYELNNRLGDRIITKIKTKDFEG